MALPMTTVNSPVSSGGTTILRSSRRRWPRQSSTTTAPTLTRSASCGSAWDSEEKASRLAAPPSWVARACAPLCVSVAACEPESPLGESFNQSNWPGPLVCRGTARKLASHQL
eukprot:scaffold51835_cov57-Phaeocystis_antarctica.AAC.1